MFPTELRIEKYYPYYLKAAYDSVRYILDLAASVPTTGVKWNTNFKVKFWYPQWPVAPTKEQVSIYTPTFTTHGNLINRKHHLRQQGHLGCLGYSASGWKHAPPGYNMLTALNIASTLAIPSTAKWIKFTPWTIWIIDYMTWNSGQQYVCTTYGFEIRVDQCHVEFEHLLRNSMCG